MTSAIESSTFIYLHNPQRHHTMIYDPELGISACECSHQKSKFQGVIKKISYCIVVCAHVSAAITTLIAGFLIIMSWKHPHTVQQWFENGPLGVVIWSLFIVNVCMCLVSESMCLVLESMCLVFESMCLVFESMCLVLGISYTMLDE
jgi:hypothetical protein